MGRKEERKQRRQSRKERRAFYSKRTSEVRKEARVPEQTEKKFESVTKCPAKRRGGCGLKSEMAKSLKIAKETVVGRWGKTGDDGVSVSKRQAQIANEKEDREIRKLEKRLGIKRKRKSIPKTFRDDGLDFLLEATEIANDDEEEDSGNEKNSAISESEDEEIDSDIKELPKYVPPAVRQEQTSSQSASLKQIQRQIRGLVNRTTESNLKSIAAEIATLYQEHSRNEVNETFTSSLLSACLSPSRVGDQILMDSVLLLATVHALVGGVEVGAYFLEQLANQTHQASLEEEKEKEENKRLANATMIFSYLYNLGLIGCQLIYDLVRKFVESFCETDIELLLLLLRGVGPDLRRDDPHALKDIVVEIQRRSTIVSDEFRERSRVKFMLETITALRHNNTRKIGYDPDKTERYRRVFRSLTKGRKVDELKIGFDDLIRVEERGRWWIVGSSWKTPTITTKEKEETPLELTDTRLLSLAGQQRMSSDAKRNIFCVLMSSDDYVDAFEKLIKMKLKDKQGREMIHVVVDCCLGERLFNPFYAYLSQKFCEFTRSYQVTFQYTVWDKLKALSSLEAFGRKNLARLLAHLFVSGALSLSALKIVDFTQLEGVSVAFFRRLFRGLLLDYDADSFLRVFARLSRVSELQHLRDGLIVFMKHFVVKSEDDDELKRRIKKAEKALQGAT
ncbi:nucleolar MIF4G domain-containing protein 1-like [Oscarella lobularis]|uniref:nucleolar MIF4G domain-containing protein 1-like n=1 Tax=Oscarella lobularis TaxID=121494 RepID=UPI0033142EE8